MKVKKLLIIILYIIVGEVWGKPTISHFNLSQPYIIVHERALENEAEYLLHDPWRRPNVELFKLQAKSSRFIYPGNIFPLSEHLEEHARLGSQRALPTYKVLPAIRVIKLERSIPTIPLDAIQQFLWHPQVISQRALEHAPYIVAGTGERLILGAGDEVYVRGLGSSDATEYDIYRTEKIYRDPDHADKVLGYGALFIANAKIQRLGDPAIFNIINSKQEVLVGDRLFPAKNHGSEQHFFPHVSPTPLKGKIIAVVADTSQVSQYQTVVLNLGTEDAIEKGMVLAVYQVGRGVRDLVSRLPEDKVQLPGERVGIVMIFDAFNHISYGLVMKAKRALHVYDVVCTP